MGDVASMLTREDASVTQIKEKVGRINARVRRAQRALARVPPALPLRVRSVLSSEDPWVSDG